MFDKQSLYRELRQASNHFSIYLNSLIYTYNIPAYKVLCLHLIGCILINPTLFLLEIIIVLLLFTNIYLGFGKKSLYIVIKINVGHFLGKNSQI